MTNWNLSSHGRLYAGHPVFSLQPSGWMAGTSPAMTFEPFVPARTFAGTNEER